MLDQKWYSSCLSDPRCLGDYLHHPQIHPFFTASEVFAQSLSPGAFPQAEAPFCGPRISLGEDFCLQRVIDEVRKRHPIDYVIWWGGQNGVPLDLDRVDIPVFVVISDWHNDKPLARLLSSVAGVFCDEKLRQRLLQHHTGLEHKVKYWPAYSFAPSLMAKATVLDEERDIDVLFIGNTNPHKYLQRNRFLLRLAQLSQFKVHIASGVSEAEHLALLRRSKIAFNHALRQEMNLRAYEAAACGALLFMASDNLEVHRFLKPGVSYVAYTPQNLEAQVQYYLAHPEARKRIARQGQGAIQSCDYTTRFAWLLQSTQELAASVHSGGLQKTTTDQASEDFFLAHALMQVTNDLGAWRIYGADQLAQQWRQLPQSLPIANALLVALADLWVHPVSNTRANQASFFDFPEVSLQELQMFLTGALQTALSSPQAFHLLIAYNLAWSYFFQANYEGLAHALYTFNQLIAQFSWPVFAQTVAASFFVLPIRYTGLYLCYQESVAVSSTGLVKPLRAGAAFLQACLQRSQHEHAEAIVTLTACIRLLPELAEAYFELAGAYLHLGQPRRAEQALSQGLCQGVFFKRAWQKYVELLAQRCLTPAEKIQRERLLQTLQRLAMT